MSSELQVFLWVASCALVTAPVLVLLGARTDWPAPAKLALGAVPLLWILVAAARVRSKLLHQFRTLSNLLESLRNQDYSMKAARAREPGELGELYRQINELTDNLKNSRQSEQELLIILEKVVSQINVAIYVFDAHERIRLVNETGASLLKSSTEQLLGSRCSDTALAKIEVGGEPRVIDFRFPQAQGRWQIRQRTYRHQGQSSRILFIADLKQVLSDEQISAWQRLIRVISHEVNNSLTPITSLCQTLVHLVAQPAGQRDADVKESLEAIAQRARSLQEFISSYARLARLPEPHKAPFPAAQLAAKLRGFFAGQALAIAEFPPVMLFGDQVQLEQALINLVKNALEANPPRAAPVQLTCEVSEGQCIVGIADRGPGIINPDNLFVPFYTTKLEGAGIGLVLCRQIAAKHDGQVSLENRADGPGAIARLMLPVAAVSTEPQALP
jgi:nitrogen fixation/metabolism regulation signal transduction histidine kinase